MRSLLKAHPQWTRRAAWVLFLAGTLLLLLGIACTLWETAHGDTEFTLLPPADYRAQGLSVDGRRYTLSEDTGTLRVPGPAGKVAYVLLYFPEPLEQPLSVELLLYPVGGGAPLRYAGAVDIGASNLEFPVRPAPVGALEAVFTGEAGQSFQLDGLFVRGQRLPRQAMLALFFQVLLLCCWGVLWGLGALLFRVRAKLPVVCAAAVLGLGGCCLLAITPLSPPDEGRHYETTYYLSTLLLGPRGEAEERHTDYSGAVSHRNAEDAYLRLMEEAFRPPESTGARTPVAYSAQYAPAYLPGAVGLTLGRLLGCGFLGVFYLGRLTNLLFYAGCVYFALRRLRAGRTLLGLTAALPMALQQAASFSPDAFINGLALLLLAYALSAIYEEGPLSWRDYALLLLFALLLAPAKVVYAPLAGLVLLIPARRFPSKRVYWAQIAVLVLGCAAAAVALNLSSLRWMSSAARADNWEGGQNYTLSFLFQQPGRALSIFGKTLREDCWRWTRQAVGEELSGLTLLLPAWVAPLLLLLLGGAAMSRRDRPAMLPTVPQKLFLALLAAGVVGLTMLTMFLAWTSDIYLKIRGVQGRYFLPVLPLIFLLFRGKNLAWEKKPEKGLLFAGALVNGYAILYVVAATIGWVL